MAPNLSSLLGESSKVEAILRQGWKYSSEASSNQLYGQLFVIPIIHISTYCLTQQQENNLQQSASSAPSEGILSSSKYLSYSSIINNNFQSYSQPEIIVWQPFFLGLFRVNSLFNFEHNSTISRQIFLFNPSYFWSVILFSIYFVVLLCGVRCLSDSISVPCNNCCGPGLDRLNIYNDCIILFMLQVGLHTLPLPAYHDTPAANITRVTHSHILAKYPLHRNKTERGP